MDDFHTRGVTHITYYINERDNKVVFFQSSFIPKYSTESIDITGIFFYIDIDIFSTSQQTSVGSAAYVVGYNRLVLSISTILLQKVCSILLK